VHLDDDPTVFGRNYACLPVLGDARASLSLILQHLGAGTRTERDPRTPRWLEALKGRYSRFEQENGDARTSDACPIRPERALAELERLLPHDAAVVADIGTSCLFVAHCMRLRPPQRCYIPMAWSCMGHPVAASVGVRMGSGKPTVCVTGDGAFLSKGLELHAAVEAGLSGLVWIVLSNQGHGLVRLGTDTAHGKGHGVEVGHFRSAANIAAIAVAVGARAARVTQASELAQVLAEALAADRPYVVEVVVDLEAMPPMRDDPRQAPRRAPDEEPRGPADDQASVIELVRPR